MNIDFDKDKMISLHQTVKYVEEHISEIKSDIKKAVKFSKELTDLVVSIGGI